MNARLATPVAVPIALTREGLAVSAFGILVALAAMNTGANLLFVALGLLTGGVITSVWAGLRLLRGITVSLELPELLEANRPFRGHVRVEPRRDVGGLSLRVRGPECLPRDGVYVEGTSRGGAREVSFEAEAPRRGVRHGFDVELQTRAPFHWLTIRRRVHLPVTLYVYPELRTAEAGSDDEPGPEGHDSTRPGFGGSLRNLRPYEPGDNPRNIHWRATARQWSGDEASPKLMVREFHDEVRQEVIVRLDTQTRDDAFESKVSLAASEVRDALATGASVELRTHSHRLRYAGPLDLSRALRFFSTVTLDGTAR